jgi:SAM-dependent methyltransferase
MVDKYDHDREWTLKNRANLLSNRNLLIWYKKLYQRAFRVCDGLEGLHILEIGSGASPLKMFYNNVITSDILALDHLDLVFDCHQIDRTSHFNDNSLDVITMTNVLHHLQDPIDFLLKASCKLKPGGWVVAIEPFFSSISKVLYKLLHHEPSDFSITEPRLTDVKGPLSSANQALPQMIFLGQHGWHKPLLKEYSYSPRRFEFYSSLSYMATGGISRRIPIPEFIYRPMLMSDIYLADLFPLLMASFFIIRLQKKTGSEK